MTNEADLDALEKVAREATPGPYRMETAIQCVVAADETIVFDGSCCCRGEWEADAAYSLTFDPPTVLRLLAALRAQAEQVRVLETAVLDAAISDRLDEAGSPLSWREVAEAAERRAGEAEARVVAEMEYANASRNIAARLHGALAEIARGDVPPEKEGHYLAHREAVRIARAALLPATQAEGEKP